MVSLELRRVTPQCFREKIAALVWSSIFMGKIKMRSLFILFFTLSLSIGLQAATLDDLSAPEKFSAPEEIAVLLAAPADDAKLGELSQSLDMGEQAQGQFTQTRHLQVLKKPLLSQGEFFFHQQLGLAWIQTAPFASSLVLTQDTLIQIDSEGQKQISRASENQQAQGLAQMIPTLMQALLQGEITPLKQQFSLHLLQDKTRWQLGLVPLDPLIAKAMQAIVLNVEPQAESEKPSAKPRYRLDSLTLLNHNGDFSQIRFSSLSNAPLSQAQLSYFETQETPSTEVTEKTPKP